MRSSQKLPMRYPVMQRSSKKSVAKTRRDELHDDGVHWRGQDGSRIERADLSNCATDMYPTPTVRQDLDKRAADKELLEKSMRDTSRVPQKSLDILRAPSGQKGWADFFAAWRCWQAEQA